MIRLLAWLSLALVMGCRTVVSSPTALGPGADQPRRTQLLQVEQAMFDAIRTRNGEALKQLLADDFELRMPGEPALGRDAFIASVQGIPGTMLEVSSDDIQARVLGDLGVLTGHQQARIGLPDGSIVTQVGAFTDVARWVSGTWVLVSAYSINVSEVLSPPAPAAGSTTPGKSDPP